MCLKNESLADAYPKEQERIKKIIKEYEKLGDSGRIGVFLLKAVLDRAAEAYFYGDVVQMIKSYKEMQGCE